MKTFFLKITSPDGNIFEGEAYMLTLRGIAGDFAVLPNHAAFTTTVVECDVKVEVENVDKLGHTEGGLLTVKDNVVTLLSGSFKWQE